MTPNAKGMTEASAARQARTADELTQKIWELEAQRTSVALLGLAELRDSRLPAARFLELDWSDQPGCDHVMPSRALDASHRYIDADEWLEDDDVIEFVGYLGEYNGSRWKPFADSHGGDQYTLDLDKVAQAFSWPQGMSA